MVKSLNDLETKCPVAVLKDSIRWRFLK